EVKQKLIKIKTPAPLKQEVVEEQITNNIKVQEVCNKMEVDKKQEANTEPEQHETFQVQIAVTRRSI
ncbi:4795_t:CDS:2, partial [Gigaspora rosea]